MDTRNQVRLDVWRQSDSDGDEFFEETIIDTDDHWGETTGECKEGIGLAYNGTWDYHPLIVSLVNTAEPLYLSNRPGNRHSHGQSPFA